MQATWSDRLAMSSVDRSSPGSVSTYSSQEGPRSIVPIHPKQSDGSPLPKTHKAGTEPPA